MSFGLALSGGGAKGAAHIGVLSALEENNLIPSSFSGTSMGAVISGLYALGFTPKKLDILTNNFSKKYKFYSDPVYFSYCLAIFQFLLNSPLSVSGLIKGDKIENYLKKLTNNKDISEVTKPLIIPAVDLITGKTIAYSNVYQKNNILPLPDVIWEHDVKVHQAMRASISLPAIFYPKKLNNRILVDGGVTQTIPINLLKASGEKNILAVDIAQEYEKPENNSITQITLHSFEIMQRELKKSSLGNETFLINLVLPKCAEMLDFKKMSEFIKIGYDSTIKVMPQLKLLFHERN